MYVDLPLSELRTYESAATDPADWDTFWSDTLSQARRHAVDVVRTQVDTGYVGVDTYDVTFRGFAGDPIRAWLRLPAARSEPFPVVQFHGFQGGRGHPLEPISWTLAGFAHLSVDNRGRARRGSSATRPIPSRAPDPSTPGS